MKTANARISSPGGMNMRLIAFGGDERMRGALLAAVARAVQGVIAG